eukprot:Skav220770  [mRNA]  locus=scaffold3169:98191:107912:+ [translate_table: standard]
MWFSLAFQSVAVGLHWWMPLSNEMTEEPALEETSGCHDDVRFVQEDRLQHQMQKEYQQYGAAQAMQAPGAAYTPGYYSSPTPGYGAPYGAPGGPPGYAQGMPPQWGAWKDGPPARFVVDGYPRSEEQLRGFQAELSSKVKREEMRQRLLGRAKSSGRVDDDEEVIEKRLNTLLRVEIRLNQ